MERVVHHLNQLAGVKPRRLVRDRANRFGSIGRFERGVVKAVREMVRRIKSSRKKTRPS